MARNEADREDLMREATALVNRGELRCPSFEQLVTVGFRRTGAMSIFIDQDPVYQFDPEGKLRRAFVAGHLYRSQHTGLAKLTRSRTETETFLLREDLTELQQQDFASEMRARLSLLKSDIDAGVQVERAVPSPEAVLENCRTSLQLVLSRCSDWLSNRIPRRASSEK
ncbi:MAG: hypothetical protein KDA96_18815 [Planctomycetaceae bacterium]|nr:hypothetical protein [Planctomycetaceae bacterium]